MVYLMLFLSFLQVGMFSIGGGYAAIPLIQSQVVDVHGWLTMEEFMNLVTIAEMTPGPIAINTSVFVGYKMRGLKGAVAALLGSVLPSFVIILAIALLFADIRHNPVVDAAFKGMRPAVVALIVVPVISLARGMHWAMFAVIAASALAVWYRHRMDIIHR